MRYVKGTLGEGLGYSPGEDLAVLGYSDASYGSDQETKKGRSGYVVLSAGAAVSWGRKLQDVVALSSTEAEYMAMGHAVHEGLYLQMPQLEMGIEPEEGGTLLLLDNQSAIKLAKNPVSTRGASTLQLNIISSRRRWRTRISTLSLLGLCRWQQIN